MILPPVFLDRLQELGLDYSIYEKHPKKAVYIFKDEQEIRNEFDIHPVPWADHLYFTDHSTEIQEKFFNSVFVQDAGSLVPVLALDVTSDHTVLDMCAAPGSKTLHIAQRAAQVIASDIHGGRIRRLRHNVRRFGITNCRVLRADGRRLIPEGKVDRVLVDAPCSGEGMVGKIHKVVKMWSVKRITRLAALQKQLVLHGLELLEEGGILVYSTCTFAPEENEGVIDWILTRGDAVLEKISVKNLTSSPGLRYWKHNTFDSDIEKTMRIYPFHNNTNGFFVARLRKG
ncbi:MAG: RsmB/NOP family class I SAM-dependent RNA methyltransferase [Theionarchaea archaeon]|nr:RsmB/NOP family class I SAM-dependent RNA methyltransferase [Theionarchaea archaeon]MBU7020338.1 RsmB/NOP family class I SAM-dependent RNA methyltransferase [Theionarchaea archaeon]MBU7034815.1 RsmB/NOP family class I SAM-dependent RNA methyltransferase [Theionarchaea archaeon]MBU7040272.1 RsmB/NOP family class I SAM-dependent RNA methyltransferase [Theionarchaea archaeon]